METRKVNWEPILAAFFLMASIFGVMVPLFTHSDNRLHELVNGIREDIKGMQEEMRDFHARLERQDAEFKGAMRLIEERRNQEKK